MTDDFSARLCLLDQQLVDADRLPIGRVDDVEIVVDEDGGGRPRAVALLVGAQALGERLGGSLATAGAGISARLRPASQQPGPARIDARLVDEIQPFVCLRVRFAELPAVAPLERWLAERVIGRLPGGRRAVE